jgi:hypothetical protein
MVTGWLAWTCLLLGAQTGAAEDVVHMNQRGFQIPIKIQPERKGDVRELILFLSRDQGKTWEIYARATPDKTGFDFFAAGDGVLWFSVAVINRAGQQDPPDVYKAPVGQKIAIDTVKPEVHIVSADRLGDEVQVAWEVKEEHPEWTSLKLEYKVGDSPAGQWTPLPIQPGPRGNQRFKPGTPGEVTIRLSLRDLAGNEGAAEKVLSGGGHVDRAVVGAGAVAPPVPSPDGRPAPTGPAPTGTSTLGAPSAIGRTEPPSPSSPASSPSTTAGAGSPMPTRGALPPLQIVNKKQVKLGFDVGRFGPSGLGGVDVYVTRDEGATWEKSPADPNVTLPVSSEVRGAAPVRGSVTVNLPSDGVVYGFHLVVKSRAGLGKPPPRSGDAPHVRLELDTTMPTAELYAPQPDPARGSALVLAWKAEDRNLDSNPVSLEWSPNRDGPWEFIGDPKLPNTGRYTWNVPDRTPPKVYLKLTVRDTAGNVAVAQTPEPVLIDLQVPEITGNVTVMPGH